MLRPLALAVLLCQFPPPAVDVPKRVAPEWLAPYRDAAGRLIGEAVSSDAAWQRLAYLGDTYGHRLSGSPNLEAAIGWAIAEMKRDGLENVHAEAVKVPRWVRGRESLEITGTVRYRTAGPSRAGALGAVAMLVRAVGPAGLRTPHTGTLTYVNGQPQIPAAAVSHEDAARLQRMADRGTIVRLKLMMEAHFLPDADSANVVGELRGRELPNEVVVIGGHFDSWDVGTGSTDDGGGCIATWEALRLMKKLNLRPRRTVRLVLWTNEENGGRGGQGYRDQHLAELANHVMMMESDGGVFRPTGFGFSGTESARARVRDIATLLAGMHAETIAPSGGGSDIGPSVQQAGIPAMSLEADGNYFLIHHTPADTVDKIDPLDLARSSAAVAVMTYVLAEMPERLR